jgi:hypothetical protein
MHLAAGSILVIQASEIRFLTSFFDDSKLSLKPLRMVPGVVLAVVILALCVVVTSAGCVRVVISAGCVVFSRCFFRCLH